VSPKILLNGQAVAVSKVLCVARNYADHAKEMGTPLPKEPVFFLKPSSALLPGGGTILLPPQSQRVEVETELAVILGAGGRDVRASDSMGLVTGYAVFFDITARDLQAKARKEGSPWTAAKGFDTFAPISEAMPASRIPDPNSLEIRLRVNGITRQNSNTSKMVFRIPKLIEAASQIMSLEPGDILATGTPAGVWPIVSGDELVADIDRVGTLRCNVASRKR
jgi:2-keto-4-pentenoate hydratase/2-oxohepta-3-ene-1,7-dioic acid hydratase in catechol pathway